MKLKELGELQILEKLIPIVSKQGNGVIVNAGDDCAITKLEANDKHNLLLKADAIIETVHFEKDTVPHLIGKKAIGKVLSDIAAMGGKPLWILVSLVAPDDMDFIKLRKIYLAMSKVAAKYDVSIVGGETSKGNLLELHIFCVGIVKAGRAILRNGAKDGDLLYVTGVLGGSIHGKHLNFKPRLAEGLWLAEKKIASSMIDITDGLLLDLQRMLKASKKSCKLYVDKIPISSTLFNKPFKKREILQKALTDGEDFELLFTVPPSNIKILEKKWPFKTKLTMIGEIQKGSCGKILFIDTKKNKIEQISLRVLGYEHFRHQ